MGVKTSRVLKRGKSSKTQLQDSEPGSKSGKSGASGFNLPVVIVVGGGYAGLTCARALDATGLVNVVLIDRNEFFYHNVGATRTSSEQHWGEKLLIPFSSNIFSSNGVVVCATVTKITKDSIQIDKIVEPLKFDYLVIATGALYMFPCKLPSKPRAEVVRLLDEYFDTIFRAEVVAIVGAGASGIEFAGEICTAYPKKKVLMFTHDSQLLSTSISTNQREILLKHLADFRNLKILFNKRVKFDDRVNLARASEGPIAGPLELKTEDGDSYTVGAVVLCVGAKTTARQGVPTEFVRGATGRYYVNDCLMVEHNIFAIGDCCLKEPQSVPVAMKQGEYVADAIAKLVEKEDVLPYKPEDGWSFMLATGGDTGLGLSGNHLGETSFGADVYLSRKCKDLLTEWWWQRLNLNMDEKLDLDSEVFRSINANDQHIRLMNKRKSRLHSKAIRFKKLLQDPEELNRFKQFLISERSSENLIFYLEVQKFKDAARQLQTQALRLFEDFCLDTAEAPVNLTSAAYAQMRQTYTRVNEHFWGELFSMPEEEIFKLMLDDSFSRYEKHLATGLLPADR
eukprot:TRINITY_DN4227_c0_g1_i1.p1 TRINITY_DN4227_c0_g1~~TRINITY_DN4227_c0_g1_i1.p1  ORF type:complete len:567 (+),score=138.67 TRINITY_DN4227_c0_g1_i1:3586-5286(+)